MANHEDSALFISAKERANIEEFKKTVYGEVRKIHAERFPYNDFLYGDYDSESGR